MLSWPWPKSKLRLKLTHYPTYETSQSQSPHVTQLVDFCASHCSVWILSQAGAHNMPKMKICSTCLKHFVCISICSLCAAPDRMDFWHFRFYADLLETHYFHALFENLPCFFDHRTCRGDEWGMLPMSLHLHALTACSQFDFDLWTIQYIIYWIIMNNIECQYDRSWLNSTASSVGAIAWSYSTCRPEFHHSHFSVCTIQHTLVD